MIAFSDHAPVGDCDRLPAVPTPGTAPYPWTGPTPRRTRPTPGGIGPRRPGKAVKGTRSPPTAGRSDPSAARPPPNPPTDPASANNGSFLDEAGVRDCPAEFVRRRGGHCDRSVGRCGKRKDSRKDCGCKHGLTHVTSPCVLARIHSACVGARFIRMHASHRRARNAQNFRMFLLTATKARRFDRDLRHN
jgi:hypothetical protein